MPETRNDPLAAAVGAQVAELWFEELDRAARAAATTLVDELLPVLRDVVRMMRRRQRNRFRRSIARELVAEGLNPREARVLALREVPRA